MAAIVASNIVTDGLIFCADAANKRCYSGSGSTCTDLAGGVTGTLYNQTSLYNSWNGVFNLDGTDDYIEFGSPAALQNQVGTVVAWARWDTTSTSQGGLVAYLADHDPLNNGWNLLNYGSQVIGWDFASSPGYEWWLGSSSYKFDTDEWVMVTMTFAGAGNPVNTYRNDILIHTESTQVAITYVGATLIIGSTDTDRFAEWQGQIGPVYIYDRVLTAAEVAQNYNATKGRF